MSELKVVTLYGVDALYNDIERQYYHKSEADNVIAELKAQKAQTEDDCAYWKTMAQKNAADNAVMAKQRAEALKKESRHKYKRCLAMARWCYAKWDDTATKYYKSVWYRKWEVKWLALADKFKEGL